MSTSVSDQGQSGQAITGRTPALQKRSAPEFISVCLINCQSIIEKTVLLESLTFQEEVDLIIATETWIPPKTSINIRGFDLVISSSRKNTEFSKYGGCAIYVKSSIDLQIKNVQEINDVPNAQIVQVEFKSLVLFAFYRSPNQDPEEFASFADFFESIENPNFVAAGDLNCRSLDWQEGLNTNDSENRIFIHMQAMNAHQYVTEPTHSKEGILDIIISTPDIVQSTKVVQKPKISDHYSVIFAMKLHNSIIEPINYPSPKDVQADDLNNLLSIYNWFELDYNDTESTNSLITSRLQNSFESLIPMKTYIPDSKNGFTKRTNDQIRLVKQKRRLHSHNLQQAEEKLEKLLLMEKNRKADKYLQFLQKSPMNVYKTFSKKQFEKKITCVTLPSGEVSTDPEVIACTLNEYYASVLVESPETNINWFDKTGLIHDIDITEQKVADAIQDIKTSDSKGPDYISNRMLKLAKPSLTLPLTLLFRSVMRSGKIPSIWKVGVVRPLAKPGLDSSQPKNTRPICCSSVIGKLLEKIVSEEIMSTLENADYFYFRQFGFRSRMSSTDCINDMVETMFKYLNEGYSLVLVAFDFSKCFDLVRHDIMLASCYNAGITGFVGQYLHSWTQNHLQYTEINGATSPHIKVTSGIFQGAVAATKLFLILTTPTFKAFKYCDLFSYADDNSVLWKFKSTDQLHEFYGDMDRYYSFCDSIAFRLNFEKSQILQIGKLKPLLNLQMGGHKIKVVDTTKILGITISATRGFQPHRDNVLNKFKAAAHSAKIMTKGASYETKLKVFTTYLKPLCTYICSVWFETRVLQDLDNEFRSFFSQCQPKENAPLPNPPSLEIVLACLKYVRISFDKHNFSNLACCRATMNEIATKESVIGKLYPIYPKSSFGFSERPLSHKISDFWNVTRSLKISTESDISKAISELLTQQGVEGARYTEQLANGQLQCRWLKRRQILTRHFETKKNLAFEFEI